MVRIHRPTIGLHGSFIAVPAIQNYTGALSGSPAMCIPFNFCKARKCAGICYHKPLSFLIFENKIRHTLHEIKGITPSTYI